jgi:hypothetical protein
MTAVDDHLGIAWRADLTNLTSNQPERNVPRARHVAAPKLSPRAYVEDDRRRTCLDARQEGLRADAARDHRTPPLTTTFTDFTY